MWSSQLDFFFFWSLNFFIEKGGRPSWETGIIIATRKRKKNHFCGPTTNSTYMLLSPSLSFDFVAKQIWYKLNQFNFNCSDILHKIESLLNVYQTIPKYFTTCTYWKLICISIKIIIFVFFVVLKTVIFLNIRISKFIWSVYLRFTYLTLPSNSPVFSLFFHSPKSFWKGRSIEFQSVETHHRNYLGQTIESLKRGWGM